MELFATVCLSTKSSASSSTSSRGSLHSRSTCQTHTKLLYIHPGNLEVVRDYYIRLGVRKKLTGNQKEEGEKEEVEERERNKKNIRRTTAEDLPCTKHLFKNKSYPNKLLRKGLSCNVYFILMSDLVAMKPIHE